MDVRSKDFSKVRDLNIIDDGEGFNVSRGGHAYRGISESMMFYKSKLKLFICQLIDHVKKNCPMK